MEPEADDEIVQKRTDATDAIIESAFERKLIVAGPGTGKTFTFRRALVECSGRGLALTFGASHGLVVKVIVGGR